MEITNTVEIVNMASLTENNKIHIIFNGEEVILDIDVMGISFNDTDTTILNVVNGVIQEKWGTNVDNTSFEVKKFSNTNNIHIYPASEFA